MKTLKQTIMTLLLLKKNLICNRKEISNSICFANFLLFWFTISSNAKYTFIIFFTPYNKYILSIEW